MPPNGSPPFNLNGLAETVVMVSKQRVKFTIGACDTDTGYWMLDAGLPVTHISDDVIVQLTKSPLLGINEKV